MTSPVSVGTVSVEVLADAKNLARKIRKEIEDSLKGLDLGKKIRDSIGTVRVPVHADLDTSGVAGRFSAQRLKVTLDLDHAAFDAKLKTLLRDRTINVRVNFTGGNVPNFGAVLSQAAQLASVLANASGQSTTLFSSLSRAAGPVGAIVSTLGAAAGAALALGAAAAVLPSAFAAAAGAAAAIPAALAGVGAVVGTLGLGFRGIADAFKPVTGGGGGGAGGQAANQARQVAGAARQVEAARRGITAANRQLAASERSLAAAQRGVLAAQRAYVDSQREVAAAEDRARRATEAVSQARRDAVEDIEDLNRSLRGAKLSEEEAALAVTDALRELNEVRLTGNIPDIQKAELAYRRAQLTLEEATDTAGDLATETDQANRKGVEGSDKVQDALRDQADAYEGVRQAQQGVLDAQNGIIDATDALKSAQDGVLAAQDGIKAAYDGLASAQDSLAGAQQKVAAGSAGVGKELIKLAPNAQRFVDAIKALKPAFESLRLDVQQQLFAGLDQTVTNLGKAWIPALHVTLGSFADTFNEFFRNLGAGLGQPQFIRDIQTGAEGARQLLEKVGKAITTNLIPAFGTLSAAAGPFLSALGDELAQIVRDFSNWVQKGKESGALTTFFDRATAAMHDIFTTGKLVTKIVGQLIGIIIGADQNTDKSALDTFNNGLQKISDWLANPANQQKIKDFVADVRNALFEFGRLAGQVSGVLDRIGITGSQQGGSVGEGIGRAIISGMIAGVGMAIKEGFGNWLAMYQHLIDWVKELFGIKSPSTVFASIGRDLILGLVQGVTGGFPNLGAQISRLRTVVLDRVRDAGSWLRGPGRTAVSGMITGIGDLLGSLRARAMQLRTTVLQAVGNAASWLYNTGRQVVSGLWSGLASLGSWLWNKVQSFASTYVTRAINSVLGISSPSRVAAEIGGYVSQGLALGIDDEAAKVKAAADRIAALAVPQVGATAIGLDGSMDTAISRSLQVADSRQVEVGWKPGSTGDTLLDGLRDLIGFRFNGDPSLALAS